jgi:hypothetical protein
MEKKDSLEGFDITDYDPETEFVTIQIHRSILKRPASQEALQEKCQEIIAGGPSVSGVRIVPRK